MHFSIREKWHIVQKSFSVCGQELRKSVAKMRRAREDFRSILNLINIYGKYWSGFNFDVDVIDNLE